MAVAAETIEAFFLGGRVSSAEREEILQQLHETGSLAATIARRFSRAARRFADPEASLIGVLPPPLEATFDQLRELNQQAADLMRSRRWDEAYPVRLNTCRLAMRFLGEEHRDTSTYLNSLARILYEQGEFERAERVYEHAIDLRSQYLGERHIDTAISWAGLGRVLEALEEYQEARDCHHFALEVTEAHFGPEHPETGVSLRDLGCVSLTLGDNAMAVACFERAVTIAREVDGENDPIHASSLVHLAAALEASGEGEAAEPLYLQSLQILEQAYGPNHADVAWCLDHLASMRLCAGNVAGALTILERAVEIPTGESRWGHLLHASIVGNLAAAQHLAGGRRNATRNYRTALGLWSRWLSAAHPAAQTVQSNLAFLAPPASRRRDDETPLTPRARDQRLVARPLNWPLDGQSVVVVQLAIAV